MELSGEAICLPNIPHAVGSIQSRKYLLKIVKNFCEFDETLSIVKNSHQFVNAPYPGQSRTNSLNSITTLPHHRYPVHLHDLPKRISATISRTFVTLPTCPNKTIIRSFTSEDLGTAVAQWLRCCATNRKVAVRFQMVSLEFFH